MPGVIPRAAIPASFTNLLLRMNDEASPRIRASSFVGSTAAASSKTSGAVASLLELGLVKARLSAYATATWRDDTDMPSTQPARCPRKSSNAMMLTHTQIL